MKRYTVLCVKNFSEVLKAIANASSDKGYQIWITNKVKGEEVTCAVCATKDGIIQGKGIFYAKLMMVDKDENGQEHKVENPSGWSRKVSMPSYFAEAAFQLCEESDSIFFSIYENEVVISNHVAEVKIPIIDNFEISKGPSDLRECRFSVDRKTLLSKVRKIQAGAHKAANDTFSFRINKEGMMEMISCCSFLIPKEKMHVTKKDSEETPFEGIAMCSVSTQKLVSLCNIDEERMEFIVYLDERLYGKQVTVKLGKKYDFLLNTKANPVEAAFDIPDLAATSYFYRLKVNAKDLRKALSILMIGQKEKITVNLTPLRSDGSNDQLIIRDRNNSRKVKIPYGELEGIIPEDNTGIHTGLDVLAVSCAPFEEVITISHAENRLLITDGNCSIVSTFAKVPDEEEEAKNDAVEADASDEEDPTAS